MVEFALVLPILLLIIYGLLEVGRLIFIYSSVVTAARSASRYGATTGILPGEIETDDALRRYNDCAEMRAAAQRSGFIQRIQDNDIAIDWDEGEGSPKGTEYEEPKPVVFGSHINDYCPPGGLPTDDSFNARRDCIGNNCRIRVEVRTQYSPIVPLVPLKPFEIRSVSARTILVSVPIVVDAEGEEWDPGAPPLPDAFSKSSPINGAIDQETSVTLTWGTSEGATSYEVCYDTTDDDACSSWGDNGALTSIQISGLAASTTYYWHVSAVNVTGTTYSNGADTAFWSFTTAAPPTSPPADFSKSNPNDGATNQATSVTLQWQASAGAASYQGCYDTTDNDACSTWADIGLVTSQTISDLAPSTTYYWHVRAVNVAGTTYSNGASTAFWSFTTAAPPPLPGAFSKVSPSNGAIDQETSVTLTWGTSADATSYEFCYDTTNDSACAFWVDNGALPSKQISGLATSTTYYWHVRALNVAGTTYSNAPPDTAFWSFTTAAPPLPAAFNKISPSGVISQTTLVTLTWEPSAGAISYEVCYDTVNDDACASDNWIPVGNNTSYDASTSQGTTYYWHVRAVNATGTTYSNGATTAFWSFTTAASACDAKADPLVFNIPDKTITTKIYNKGTASITISQLTITWNNSNHSQEITSIQVGSTTISITPANKKVSPYIASGLAIPVPVDVFGITLQVTFKNTYVSNGNESILVYFADPCSGLILTITPPPP